MLDFDTESENTNIRLPTPEEYKLQQENKRQQNEEENKQHRERASEDFKRASEDFKRASEAMNKKHGFNKDEQHDSLNETSMDQNLREFEFSRKQDDIELDNLLLNPDEFAHDKKRKDIIMSDKLKSNEMSGYDSSKFDEPSKYISLRTSVDGLTVKLATLDIRDDIYIEDEFEGNAIFSHINKNNITFKKSDIDFDNLQPAAYYENHNNIDINYDKLLEERIHEYNNMMEI